MESLTSKTKQRRCIRNGILGAAVLTLAPFVTAEAATVAQFEWVDSSGSTGSGALTLALPGTITTPQFTVANATFSQVTGFDYTFSSGLSVDLADLTVHTFSTTPASWTTTTITSSTTGGSGIGDTDLTTGFIFSGSNNLKIAESQGTLFNIQVANNLINPASGGVSNDFGYWKLESLTPVPLPAALPLLLSGLGMIAMRRRRTA
jgi:hypothetical protein